jgi:hypothetical protein
MMGEAFFLGYMIRKEVGPYFPLKNYLLFIGEVISIFLLMWNFLGKNVWMDAAVLVLSLVFHAVFMLKNSVFDLSLVPDKYPIIVRLKKVFA